MNEMTHTIVTACLSAWAVMTTLSVLWLLRTVVRLNTELEALKWLCGKRTEGDPSDAVEKIEENDEWDVS